MRNLFISLFLAVTTLSGWTQKSNVENKTFIAELPADNPKSYCTSTYTNTTDDWITNVSFNSIDNPSEQDGPDSYGDYTSLSTVLIPGNSYTLSVTFFSGSYIQHVFAWIDWNNDEDFDDAGEEYDLGEGISTTKTLSITVPYWAYEGSTRMRIIEQYSTDPAPCGNPHPTVYGETEDYSLDIFANNYCIAYGGCDEYISEVTIGGLNSTSNCEGYMFGTGIWDIPLNHSAKVIVQIGNGYIQDQCGIWVDWNRDEDFDDSYEEISVLGSPGIGPYIAYLSPPPGATYGVCRVRIRLTYDQTPAPCGPNDWGEIEDYEIMLLPEMPIYWTGEVDNNWHNRDNWNSYNVPDATTDVIIPDVINKCWVWAFTAYCNNITVENGSGSELRIYNEYLEVSGNMNIHGDILMDHDDSNLIVDGDIIWEAGSQAHILAWADIEVNGDWIFMAGANVHMDMGNVFISGTGNSYIRTFEENCYFYHLLIYKSSSAWASIGSANTANLHIHGQLGINLGATLYIYSPESLYLKSGFLNTGTLLAYDGTFVMDGDIQGMYLIPNQSIQEFNNLTISSTTLTSIDDDISIAGSLTIEEGQFICNDHTISIQGNWDNQVGPGGFDPGTGRVIFDGGNYHQYCSDETFNILEVDKPLGGAFRMQATHVECASYDWTAGAIDVIPGGGSFTANDLFEEGISGGIWGEYYLNPGGTINLTNNDGYLSLNGEIHIFGGVMNVYGNGNSFWPYQNDGLISMSDGILDFHNMGIFILPTGGYTLIENITGGTIRTSGSFLGESASFAPDEGTIEFYGSDDANIYTQNGCRFNNVIVNKTSKGKANTTTTEILGNQPIIESQSKKNIKGDPKSNTLSVYDILIIDGNLEINNGTLNSDGYDIQIAGNWINNVGDPGFTESSGKVIFIGEEEAGILTNEIFANIEVNRVAAGWDNHALEIPENIEVDVTGNLILFDGLVRMNPNSKLRIDNNLFIHSGAGLRANADDCEIEIGGEWGNNNPVNNLSQGFYSGGETVTFNGNSDQPLSTYAPEEFFTNLIIDKLSGSFIPADHIYVGGNLEINNGYWLDQGSGLNHKFGGDITIEANGGYAPLGTTTIVGLFDQYFTNNGGNVVLEDLVIDKNDVFFLNSNLVVPALTSIEEGILNLNGNSFRSQGTININDGGELQVDAGASLSLYGALYVNNGGQFTASGNSENLATVWNDMGGEYDFEVKSGGNISANYANLLDMNMHGIDVEDGAYIDPVNAFNNCNFYNGIPLSFSALLRIENNQELNISNINFYNLPTYADAFNIYKSVDKGEIVITTTAGDFTGPLYEYDDYNRIHWPDFIPGLWTGAVSDDWIDSNNWSDFQTPSVTTDVVIPAGTPHNPRLQFSPASCNSLVIESGASMKIVDDVLLVTNNCDIYGQLIMNHPLAYLECFSGIYWKPGSTADVTDGYIRCHSWVWEDGTLAQLGVGNTAGIRSSIENYDLDASFGNLDIWPPSDIGPASSKADYPIKISGNCTIKNNAIWIESRDWQIDGNWIFEDGATFNLTNASNVECYGALNLAGELYITENSEVWIHDIFTFPSTGNLKLNEGLFLCDYSLPSGWIHLMGDIDLSLGSLEFPDANISFGFSSNISGGTIIAGRSFAATGAGGFQPTGGIIELTGTGTGHYVQVNNGNYVHNLTANRDEPILINWGDDLLVQGDLNLFSELMLNENTLTVYGNVEINAGGMLTLGENEVLAMADNQWLAINAGGKLKTIGTPGNEATITHTSGNYNFWIGDGATISAEHAIFEYMGTDGVHLNYGAMVDPTYSFNNCVFQNGATGGVLMTVDNTQNFTANNVEFPTNSWGSVYNVYKTSTPGNITFMDAIGSFAGEAFEYDPNNLIHWGAPELRLDLKVFLEGPFNGSSMNTDINSILPHDSPFDPPLPYFGNSMPDWYYASGGTVSSIPNSSVVDWVLVQLRDATSPGAALPATNIETTPAFVKEDGSIISMDGTPYLTFTSSPINDLYVVIWQRNHLGVLSSNPLVESGGIYTYDFSSGASQAYGGTNAQVQLSSSPTIWGMMAGDGDGDGEILVSDKLNVWNTQTGTKGYLESDYNLNGHSENKDKNELWLPNKGKGTAIPE